MRMLSKAFLELMIEYFSETYFSGLGSKGGYTWEDYRGK